MAETELLRFDRFKEVVEKALDQCVKTLTLEKLVSCYPMYQADEGRSALETAREQIVEYFRSTCMSEFELIYQERDLKNKLDSLDKLINKAKARSVEPGSEPLFLSGMAPIQILEAKLLKSRLEVKAKQERLLESLEKDVIGLYGELNKKKKELSDTVESINDSMSFLRDLNVEVEELEDSKVDKLFKFVVDRDLEQL
ncbi:unnamed protein product [Kuraishia capsulata CBS 1993]|uniref:Uncharacterized protein n=1 Tax=Kuraishia capsulata CBS 1993 TaxID=1382522 RepID=W6MF94_9ASCO|nr:uncharacterized protein KUCA_T00000096001 [Kuraishia capsulata CBS 1993]CDK24136.1 unnamed protein product [Kuraishia capsulata CBS 1993]